MKTYKAWEVVKMLSENPKLRFKLVNPDDYIVFVDAYGKIVAYSDCGYASPLFYKDDTWELLQEPMTFVEAIKALKEGKTVRCEIEDDHFARVYKPTVDALVKDSNGEGLTIHEILDGKWYVEVGNE